MAEVLVKSPPKIWTAIRKTPEIPEVVCDTCLVIIEDHEIYNERLVDSPMIICYGCVQNLIESRLALIGEGG